MNIGTHLVNNLLELAGRCRSVSATATTGGRAITPEDVVPAPSGMGYIGARARRLEVPFELVVENIKL